MITFKFIFKKWQVECKLETIYKNTASENWAQIGKVTSKSHLGGDFYEKIVTLGNSGKWVCNEAMGAQKGA